MKKLLIHANNTSLNTQDFFSIAEEFVFDVDLDKDVDEYIDGKLRDPVIIKKIVEADLLFIKLSLSNSYLEFLGLRLANHIRLTESLGEKSLIPIIFVGEETYEFVAKFAPEPSIFFTKGVYLIQDSKAGYEYAMAMFRDQRIRSAGSITQIVNRLNIQPPADHLSHHSITNEWSVLRWAKSLQIENNSNFLAIRQRVEQLLYYKYLKYKYPVPDHIDLATHQIKGTGKVLLIDDEWKKGWGNLFNEFFKDTEIDFVILQNEFKDKQTVEVVDMCEQKVKNINPDVVILDLRLTDGDISKELGSSLTGHEVLECIKKINPGIQVILLTASNKIWNLTSSSGFQPDGFILKESPELSVDASYSKKSIEKMADLVEECLSKSFLKEVYNISENILSLTKIANYSGDADFKTRLKSNLAIAFKLLNDTHVSAKFFNYAYLQLFQIIEDFAKQPTVFYEGDPCIVYVDGKEVIVKQEEKRGINVALNFNGGKYIIGQKFQTWNRDVVDTNFKVAAILIFRYGNTNSSEQKWNPINNKRNRLVAHFNTDSTITSTDVIDVLNFIFYFIDDGNQNTKNASAGIVSIPIEDKVQALTEKYKKR